MGIVFGYLSLICFCMLVAKWIARRCNLIKFDKVLMRIHRPVIVDNVVATQKIDVDAVSGATNSSNVIKKAIENAVTQ